MMRGDNEVTMCHLCGGFLGWGGHKTDQLYHTGSIMWFSWDIPYLGVGIQSLFIW